jgi:dTDP-4-amino-4,6-dideoxygalactose transaminase
MRIPLLDLKAQYTAIKPRIMDAIEAVCDSQAFILGEKVSNFERQMAQYCGCRFGIGVSSGSDALLICLMAEDIGQGDEVITTPYTFFATAGAIARTGAKPVFADIDPATYNIDSDRIEAKITGKTKVIIPVHLFGQCADMSPILAIARKYGLVVIEDAAQSIGAEGVIKEGEKNNCFRAGTVGDYGCFSFFPSKNLGAFGDGGMVVTNDPDKAERLTVLRSHGSKPKYHHSKIGGNFRLDALQAAVLMEKLSYLDQWSALRRSNAKWYDKQLQATGLVDDGLLSLPQTFWKQPLGGLRTCEKDIEMSTHYHVYNQYVIKTPFRDKLQRYLHFREIGTAVYYPVPLHLQECFSYLGHKSGDFPASESSAASTLAIPIYPELTKEQQQYVVDAIVDGLR